MGNLAAMPVLAATLRDALEVLELQPIEFLVTTGTSRASDPSYYVEPPPQEDVGGGLPEPTIAKHLGDELLSRAQHTKIFLSGHVGSGKSTQVNRLAADPRLRDAFSIVILRIEAEHQAFLDAAQLLFLMVCAIHDFGHRERLLSSGQGWKKKLEELDACIYGGKGVVAKGGNIDVEVDLLFVKLKQELAFEETRRNQFRDLGETLRTLLIDVIKALLVDIETCLAKQGRHHSPLLLVDDLDKVRGPEQQSDIFDKNLELLKKLPLRVLFTVPTGVVFGPSRADLRSAIAHLYPIRVVGKSPDGFDVEKAFIPGSDAFFREVLDHRVEAKLYTDEAVRLAAIYAGGVLREFFRLLRSATMLARHHELDVVDERAVRGAVRTERRRETMGLLLSDYATLLEVHRTHGLPKDEDRRYLDEGRVLECYNDKTWYEANPLLWKVLEPSG